MKLFDRAIVVVVYAVIWTALLYGAITS